MPRSNLITMNCLGRQGRWGNQVFQYAFLRTYARRYGLQYQANRWIGQALLGHDDPRITEHLPIYRERKGANAFPEQPDLAFTHPPEGDEARGHDVQGYCQFHTSYYEPEREFIRGLFVPLETVQQRMKSAVAKLRSNGNTIIGLHMRRGDTGRFIFYLTPNQWYLKWLEEHWDHYSNPVLFIASEEPSDRQAFAKYSPVTSSDLLALSNDPCAVYNYLEGELRERAPIAMDWFPDWYLLTQCDVLVFGNSTFSFTAAMMNQKLQAAWRSRLSTQMFEHIDPWNEWSVAREDLREYPGIAGTWHDQNKQWQGGEVCGRN